MIIKPATELNEFLQIHQLNYTTFVEEIPQNMPNPEKSLIDKFHLKNHYIVAKRGENVIGWHATMLNAHFPWMKKLMIWIGIFRNTRIWQR